VTTGPSWDGEAAAYLAALRRGDRQAAVARARLLRRRGCTVAEVITHLVAPAQLRIGELWARDEWSEAQEHAATAISEAVLSALGSDAPAPSPDAPTVVVSCVEEEWHALPALMVAEQLRADGWAVSYLGANSSAQGLLRHVHETGPRAVLLSCSLPAFLPLLRRQIEAVRETGTPVVVGGSAIDAGGRRARTLGATAFTPRADGIGALLATLPVAVPPAAPLAHPGADEAYAVLGAREDVAEQVARTVARSYGLRLASAPEPWLRVLEDQLPYLVGSVAGALVCDDRTLVEEALPWAHVVLSSRGAPADCAARVHSSLRAALRDLPVAASLLSTR
jgi:methanogenic corrinoid protein MtbC1